MEQTTLSDATESVPYIIQNLKAVYGVPVCERGLDPLDVLIGTILSQSTTDVNSRRAFESLKRRFPTWDEARRVQLTPDFGLWEQKWWIV
jgi:endonuclease III